MIGSVGFLSAAIVFYLYGYTAFKFKKNNVKFPFKPYLIAYGLISLAFLTWSLAFLFDSTVLLGVVLIGDILLFASSAFLLSTIVKKQMKSLIFIIATPVVATIVFLRAQYDTAPVIQDGVLFFNTPRLFGFILAIIFWMIWLRANMRFHDSVINGSTRTTYYSYNIIALISVSAFLLARKPNTIIFSFGTLIFAYALLSTMNYLLFTKKRMLKDGKR